MSEDQGPPPERPSFANIDEELDLLADLDTLGPRDRNLLSVLIEKVRQIELEHGEEAACAMIDAVIAILQRQRPGRS